MSVKAILVLNVSIPGLDELYLQFVEVGKSVCKGYTCLECAYSWPRQSKVIVRRVGKTCV